jgi:hypothetical protein
MRDEARPSKIHGRILSLFEAENLPLLLRDSLLGDRQLVLQRLLQALAPVALRG